MLSMWRNCSSASPDSMVTGTLRVDGRLLSTPLHIRYHEVVDVAVWRER